MIYTIIPGTNQLQRLNIAINKSHDGDIIEVLSETQQKLAENAAKRMNKQLKIVVITDDDINAHFTQYVL
jgi:hypothetical protein